jgi:hypothetical protein
MDTDCTTTSTRDPPRSHSGTFREQPSAEVSGSLVCLDVQVGVILLDIISQSQTHIPIYREGKHQVVQALHDHQHQTKGAFDSSSNEMNRIFVDFGTSLMVFEPAFFSVCPSDVGLMPKAKHHDHAR